MHQVSLAAESRTNVGKGAARSLRRDGRVPAVIYGHGRDPLPLSVDHKEVGRLLEVIGGEAALVNVSIDGAAAGQVIVREVQRNPVKRSDVIHLDLYAVVAGQPITVEVPVHIEGTADGVRNFGGVLDLHLHRLTVKCLPKDIPDHIVIDVTALLVGEAIHVRDVTVPNAELMHDGDVSIVGVLAGRVEEAATPADSSEPEVINQKGKAEEAETEGE
ncbi:MAG: 50S ribosomal protein L25 [Gemmatimonadales bacterium]|nr:50S ribosomal protein L25 [Gemmatimonadales bacterium]MDZ4389448.1 50S ribosomal protein L25 [Gemmatimonadales bacterium]